MMSARRAYSDAVKWLRSARPSRLSRLRFAEGAVGATITAATPLLCLIALGSPEAFGSPSSNTLRSGWPLYALLAVLVLSILYLIRRAAHIKWAIARIREPFVRAPEGDQRYENAADALAHCPGPLKTRFALWWIWAPIGAAGLATMSGFSAAYFVIDAILASGNVGWGHPVLAAVNLAVSLILYAMAAGRLTTWRLAFAIHKSVTVGY
jgi:hypothetical protein